MDAKTEKINFKEVLMCLKTNKYIYAIALMVLIYNLVSNMGVAFLLLYVCCGKYWSYGNCIINKYGNATDHVYHADAYEKKRL